MSFGHFLNNFASGLGQGVETGEYIKGAMDRKARRDEGKRVFTEQEAKKAASAPAPGTAPAAPATAAPAPAAPAAPAPAEGPRLPSQMVAPAAPPQQPGIVPAQRIGAQAPTFATQFPAGVVGHMGVTGPQARFPADPYGPQLY
jgi:hypothetical protein